MTEQLKNLWQLAFGDTREMVDAYFDTAYDSSRCRFLEEAGKITAALHWLDCELAGEKYAYIYAVATHPDLRGRGLCRRLMERTHEDLKRQGYAGAILKPGEEGLRKMYASMGYETVTHMGEKEVEAGEESTEVRQLTQDQYAALRRQKLPRGALLQEGENLRYLATYAHLYAAENTVFAAVHGENRLFIPELLGDAAEAPRILRSMAYPKATVRTPGKDIPFAMYHPLKATAPIPAYLGFAFD